MTTLKDTVLFTIAAYNAINANNEDLMNYATLLPLVEYRNEVAAVLAEHYEVEAKVSQKTGWMTFEKDSAAEQMLKKFHKLHPDSTSAKAKSSGKSEAEAIVAPVEVCEQIEGIILQSGMNRAQFNALMAQLKASIDFE
jgi:hypothetical protein